MKRVIGYMQVLFGGTCVIVSVIVTVAVAGQAYSLRAANGRMAAALDPVLGGPVDLDRHLVTVGSRERFSSSPGTARVVMIVDDFCEECAAVARTRWMPLITGLRADPVTFVFVTAGSPAAAADLARAASEAGAHFAVAEARSTEQLVLGTGVRAVPTLLVIGVENRLLMVDEGDAPIEASDIRRVIKSDATAVEFRLDAAVKDLLGVHGQLAGEKCIAYNVSSLQIVDVGASGFELRTGATRLQSLDNRADADQALRIASLFSARCDVVSGGQVVMRYWKLLPSKKVPPPETTEDCVPYNPSEVRVAKTEKSWSVTAGPRLFGVFDTEEMAHRALAVATENTAHCFVGRRNRRGPSRADYIMEYWK
jgi:hypothetical protein